ncbi:hypothetical protein BDV38DRAFT_130664 [Aspergillus pseudotamarii]|uniref:Uncharacterized protein n=1 Tax=Aspergillus pseudotamarii TaxID=132259 RepID=A0A5N6SLY7_ASPPS|nr:uncharacterized protein BDV38DRAFT_130664 [Aspergillus pseudotamarii]KAE8135716.1 hypothetical protein BDV38DRAFT_130664 [Aspergillus pseudotamarii]
MRRNKPMLTAVLITAREPFPAAVSAAASGFRPSIHPWFTRKSSRIFNPTPQACCTYSVYANSLSPVAQTPEETGFLLLLIYFLVIFSVQDRGKSTPRMT